MFLFQLIDLILALYALALVAHFVLPMLVTTQQPWMTTLAKICEPGVKIGNQVAAKVLKNRTFKTDIGALAAALLCWIIKILLGLFLW
ncbi:MAG: YggT family protein [Clostridia bacterium]|nr:YggT family protein [Clostridia bacterium]